VSVLAVSENLLIVEDNKEWSRQYNNAATAEGFSTIRVAPSLAPAIELVEEMRFAVAFVDIGLSMGDERNADGLRVMEKIRSFGDKTSIIVVTGRDGGDVVPILRDAFKEYHITDVVRKKESDPERLRQLVREGLAAFGERVSTSEMSGHESLRQAVDGVEPWQLDDQLLRMARIDRGADGLYEFVDKLLAGLLPLVWAENSDGAVAADAEARLIHGTGWSRGIGKPIAICFGEVDRAQSAVASAEETGKLLGTYLTESVIRRVSANGLHGAVFAMRNAPRASFVGS